MLIILVCLCLDEIDFGSPSTKSDGPDAEATEQPYKSATLAPSCDKDKEETDAQPYATGPRTESRDPDLGDHIVCHSTMSGIIITVPTVAICVSIRSVISISLYKGQAIFIRFDRQMLFDTVKTHARFGYNVNVICETISYFNVFLNI